MKIKSIFLISTIVLTTTAANAGTPIADFYVGAMLGAGGQSIFSSGNNKTDSSMLAGAMLGVDIPLFRIEGEYNYIDSSDLSTNSAMLNAYFKVPSTLIQPYFGAGVGMVFGGTYSLKTNEVKTNYDIKSTAGYQGMLGATIELPVLPVKFDIEGRVLYAPNIFEIPLDNKTPDMLQYNGRIKVRYIF